MVKACFLNVSESPCKGVMWQQNQNTQTTITTCPQSPKHKWVRINTQSSTLTHGVTSERQEAERSKEGPVHRQLVFTTKWSRRPENRVCKGVRTRSQPGSRGVGSLGTQTTSQLGPPSSKGPNTEESCWEWNLLSSTGMTDKTKQNKQWWREAKPRNT